MSPRTALAALTVTLLALPWLGSGPAVASGGGDEVIQRGSCRAHADWKLKVKPDDGRIELEAEVDSNRAGQVWHWRLSTTAPSPRRAPVRRRARAARSRCDAG